MTLDLNDISTIFGVLFSFFALIFLLLLITSRNKGLYFILMVVFSLIGLFLFIQGGIITQQLKLNNTNTTNLNVVLADVGINKQRPVDIIKYNLRGKYEDNNITGSIKWFDLVVNPSNPINDPIVSTIVVNNVAVDNTKTIKTNIDKQLIFDGGSDYYDQNFGIHNFSYDNKNVVQIKTVEITNVTKVARIGSLLDKDKDGYFSNGYLDLVNNIDEVPIITYDASQSKGGFKIPIIIDVNGYNSEVHNLGIVFVWDSERPPQGDEYGRIEFVPTGGNESLFSNIGYTNFVSIWERKGVIPLGDVIESGIHGEYDMVITTSSLETMVLNSDDEWTMCIDDLTYDRDIDGQIKDKGVMRGDMLLSNKAKESCIIFRAVP